MSAATLLGLKLVSQLTNFSKIPQQSLQKSSELLSKNPNKSANNQFFHFPYVCHNSISSEPFHLSLETTCERVMTFSFSSLFDHCSRFHFTSYILCWCCLCFSLCFVAVAVNVLVIILPYRERPAPDRVVTLLSVL